MCQPAFGRIPILLRTGWSPPSQAPKLRRTRQRARTSVAWKALVADFSRAADPCEAQVGADVHNCPTIHPSTGDQTFGRAFDFGQRLRLCLSRRPANIA